MLDLELRPSDKVLTANLNALAGNEYPGRIIAMSANIIAYGLTGRGPDTRDREFIPSLGGFKTSSPTKTEEEMAAVEDAALIYYQATLSLPGLHVASNGAQTEPILQRMEAGLSLGSALKTAGEVPGKTIDGVVQMIDLSRYEPDTNHTPRIASARDLRPDAAVPFGLTIVRKDEFSDTPLLNFYGIRSDDNIPEGVGYVVQTYNGNSDGLLPSFDKVPYPIEFAGDAKTAATALWNLLNEERKVAVLAQTIDTYTGEITGRHTISIHD